MSAGNKIQQTGNKPRRFLECVEVKFLTELVSEPSREGAPLDLSANREELGE